MKDLIEVNFKCYECGKDMSNVLKHTKYSNMDDKYYISFSDEIFTECTDDMIISCVCGGDYNFDDLKYYKTKRERSEKLKSIL